MKRQMSALSPGVQLEEHGSQHRQMEALGPLKES